MFKKISDENISNISLKVRLYPTESQKILIEKTFGCCRKIFNERLQERNEFYIEHKAEMKGKTKEEKEKIYSTFKPKSEKEWKVEYPFLSEVSSVSLQQARIHCDDAFKKFFDNLKKNRNVGKKGNRYGFPQFKSKKDNHQSYSELNINDNCKINFEERYIVVPKLKKIKFRDKNFPRWWNRIQKLNSITISKSSSGNYYASILFEIEKETCKIKNRKDSIGLDFDCDDGYIDSDGKSALKDYGFIKQKQGLYWDSESHVLKSNKTKRKLKRLQRWENRKMRTKSEDSPRKVNSKNREKARIKLARFEEHIANSRRDWIEKETLRLVRNYDKVVVEDLNYKAMMGNSRNARNYEDISWGNFRCSIATERS